ncbi:hypothetical protein EPN15_00180 [Patescibacteria group bacterium]|nr:MAG: hypothetical protein EPN15_00180 [Patescibacteria group bacterium]
MKLVLLDLDNTLIDANYNLTAPKDELCAVVRELASRDIHIGLCSDSAVITLRQWTERLGLTGPIVAERGAVLWDAVEQTEEVLEISITGWFRELRELFIREIMRDSPEATIILGDATRIVKDRIFSAALTTHVFAVNGFRTSSFSFFACRLEQNRPSLIPDAKLLANASRIVAKIVGSLGRNKNDLFWDENPKYGILIIHALSTEKWRGVSTLIDRLKPEQTVMIGDSMSDFLGLPHVAQYAVGNADPLYKDKSAFVAERSLTEGVIECLRQL